MEILIEKVKNYLDTNNIKYINNSFNYSGIRKNMVLFDGRQKTMEVISYMTKINDNEYDNTALYFVYIDAETKMLDFIMGPQSLKKINK